jgi:hypothetical protein
MWMNQSATLTYQLSAPVTELYHNQHRSDGTDPSGSNAVYRTWFSLIQAA